MTLLQWIGIAEALIILCLAEPALNRMSPCAPLLIRLAFHAIAIGSALRLYHLFDGHEPSWSALVQSAGLCCLLIVDALRNHKEMPKPAATVKRRCQAGELSIPPSSRM